MFIVLYTCIILPHEVHVCDYESGWKSFLILNFM
jgi:hypothetical protein